MNCPHCREPIADAVIASAAARLAAAKPRKPRAGKPCSCEKCGELFSTVTARKYHRCPVRLKVGRKAKPVA